MSVYVTLQVSADPAAFEAQAASNPEVFERIMAVAQSNGLIAHRWFGGDGESLAVDEWPDADSFHAFFEEAGLEIGPLMEAIGVTSPPQVKIWSAVELGDTVGWGT
jgi:hypothetical protein